MPTTSHHTEFFPLQQTVTAKHTDFHFAARAPPTTVADVTVTGAAVAEHGNGVIMHGHETDVASLGFGVGLDAPNKRVRPNRSPDGQYSNLFDGDAIIRDNPVRTLVQDADGRYWLQSANGQRITPSGQYNFVTMPDGTIRVTKPNTTVLESGEVASTHLGLSNGNPVSYAGSITFANRNTATRGSIRSWSNDSGHYRPAASDAGNAGLPTGTFNSSFD